MKHLNLKTADHEMIMAFPLPPMKKNMTHYSTLCEIELTLTKERK